MKPATPVWPRSAEHGAIAAASGYLGILGQGGLTLAALTSAYSGVPVETLMQDSLHHIEMV